MASPDPWYADLSLNCEAAEIRRADDEAAARADELLARVRGGPPGREGEGGPRDLPAEDRPLRVEYPPPPPQQPQGSVTQSVPRGGVSGSEAGQ